MFLYELCSVSTAQVRRVHTAEDEMISQSCRNVTEADYRGTLWTNLIKKENFWVVGKFDVELITQLRLFRSLVNKMFSDGFEDGGKKQCKSDI